MTAYVSKVLRCYLSSWSLFVVGPCPWLYWSLVVLVLGRRPPSSVVIIPHSLGYGSIFVMTLTPGSRGFCGGGQSKTDLISRTGYASNLS